MKSLIKLFLPAVALAVLSCTQSSSREMVNSSPPKGESFLGSFLFLVEEPLQAREFKSRHYPLPGRKVLAQGQKMAFIDREIIVGNCSDFVEAVYTRAGYTPDKRITVFSGSHQGPYADPKLLKPGDCVSHINLEFQHNGHVGIFVRWLDKENQVACMLDYVGMMRREPGNYKPHQLTKVYRISRGKPDAQ